MLNALGRKEIEVPCGPLEIVEAMVNAEIDGLEGWMNRERNVEVLRGGEHAIVLRVAVRDASDGKRADEGAFASVLDGAFEFARGFFGIAERKVRDRNELAAGVAAEVGDPSVVGAAIGCR